MSGSEISVLRGEAGQDNSMPAWKREILERRKARIGGSIESYSSAVTTRFNGELNGDNVSSPMVNKNYRITPASRHFSGKPISTRASPQLSFKTNNLLTLEKDVSCRRRQENLVLQDSLGPLQENPFIKLEKERKKQQEQENASRSIQHILELYGNVPGIRTIRAENIIIIESDPDYIPEAQDNNSGSNLHQNGSCSSLSDLLDLKGNSVTEIRAKEVVIYNSVLSKAKARLRTLSRRGSDGELERLEGRGRVSRMLQKFDCNYDKIHPKSRSNENLLDIDTCPVRQRHQPKLQLDQVPKTVTLPRSNSPTTSQQCLQTLPVFLSTQISQSTSQSLPSSGEQESSMPCTGSPKSLSSSHRQLEEEGECNTAPASRKEKERSQATPLRERDHDAAGGSPKPKVPSSPERAHVCAKSSFRLLSTSSSFEIRPAPLPDLSALPAGDIQARALANLRLQSRNSFTVIPKRQMPSSSCATPPSFVKPLPTSCPRLSEAETQPGTVPMPLAPALPPSTPSSPKNQERGAVVRKAEVEPPKPDPPVVLETLPSPSVEPRPCPNVQVVDPLSADHLPVTNIDDVVVEHPQPVKSPVVLNRKGNTFTVVPKRRPDPKPGPFKPQDPTEDQEHVSQTPKPAPYAHLGSLLKKRYPTAEEIEVIGGYLSLSRSCLSKTGSTRKKLKISFNESSLHSTFEYPSESSLWDSGDGENEEEDGEKGDIVTERFFIPRPNYTTSPTFSSNTIDLSSYTPKHSVDFSAWQEQKHQSQGIPGDSNTECADISLQEVMLTPADSSSHSGFISEPALYF